MLIKKIKENKRNFLGGALLFAASLSLVLALSDQSSQSPEEKSLNQSFQSKTSASESSESIVSIPEEVKSVSVDTSEEATLESQADEMELSFEEQYPEVIQKNKSLYEHLRELEIDSPSIIYMVQTAKPIKNLSYLRPGTRFRVTKDEQGDFEEIEFYFSPVVKLLVSKTSGAWAAEKILEKVDIKEVTFAGRVEFTLWESALAANMDPYLIIALADIFGWEVDFGREVQVGDRWRINVEQKFVKGQPVGWGDVLAAEYENMGESHIALLFKHEGENIGYFTPEGESLRRMFLKSPLKFGRITSHFSRSRFHPKLKRYRRHNGVDYGAPIGTPVRAVADGTILSVGWRGGGGKVVKVRHNAKYKTAYKHLSRYAPGMRPGVKVRQGQTIAYVGNTGLSTGPHLHYEFYVHGRFVDPLKQEFPSADPVDPELMTAFKAQAQTLVATLPTWESEKSIQRNWAHELIAPEAQANSVEMAIQRKPSSEEPDKTL